MSNSSSGEKTELPTPKKERDARQKGQIARSQEVVTTFSLFAVCGYLWVSWDMLTSRLIALFDQVAKLAIDDFGASSMSGIYSAFWDLSFIMLPILGVTIVAAVAANYFQIGSLFTFETIRPKGEKISLIAGFKRIFSMNQVVELLKSIAKVVILSVLLYFIIRDAIAPYINSLHCGLPCIGNITISALGQTLVYSAISFIAVALIDFAYQKHSHTKSLMMTKEEVKKEYKESEGDPEIKGRRRQLAQEMAMSDDGVAARKGTAVVVNPTHFAVVIDYTPEQVPLPIITAKGRNRYAHFLRSQAEEAGVPVFCNVDLARALYADGELFHPVPDELFEAVAEVLAWVSKNQHLLYKGRLDHGAIDMDSAEHRRSPRG